MKKIILTSVILIASTIVSAKSKPVDGFSAFLLGQPKADAAFQSLVPNGESAVSALAVNGSGVLVGGTTVLRGKAPWIFTFRTADNVIKPEQLVSLEKVLPGETSVSSLVKAADGAVYGTTNNYFDADYMFKEDWDNSAYEGGAVFKVDVAGAVPSVKTLVRPFKNEGIAALVSSKDGWTLYGITTPTQILFAYDVKNGKATEVARLKSLTVTYHRVTGKSTKALALDTAGNVYGTNGGYFFRFNPKTKVVDTLKSDLLNETNGDAYDCAASFAVSPDNKIYCGTFLDGKLLELNPVTGDVRDLGITSRTGNLSSLAIKNGILYGLSGSEESRAYPFTYEPATGTYKKIPKLKVYFENTDKKYKYNTGNLFGLVLLPDGSLAMGEKDFNGHLYTWKP
ncbi:MAG: hypothetical protein JNL74_13885 [Fibrobacteres bacterium]|nr:hypothetical protein [Fibrobacterota bacterium]